MTDKFNLGEIKLKSQPGETAGNISYYYSVNSRVKASHYPNCCTGAILFGLGGSGDAYDSSANIDELKEQVEAWIEAIDNRELKQSKQFISACTTSQQKRANKVLEELGFVKSGLMTNKINDYPLYTWVLALSGYEEEE